MALTTFSGLKASIANYLHRSDLTTIIPDFISLAEAKMNRRLRVRAMVARSTVALDAEYETVPTDFLGVVSFSLNDSIPIKLRYLTPDQADVAFQGDETGEPRYYSVVGGSFRFYPAPNASWSAVLTYYQSIPALSDAATTNWLLTSHPDAYLYGALLEAAPYLRDDARLAVWAQLYTTVLDAIEQASARESMGDTLTPLPNGMVA